MKNKALILNLKEDKFGAEYLDADRKPLEKGEVRVKTAFSGINFKDRLAMKPESKVVRKYPIVPGIDFSGYVEETGSSQFAVGDEVFVTGLGYGTDRDGGFSEYVIVKEEDLCVVPDGLSLKEVMQIGTAGFTAALSVDAVSRGEALTNREILVTGGTGGVSSFAIMLLNSLGAKVTAATRSLDHEAYLRSLGAHHVILFETLLEKRKPLSKERWDGVIDATGGEATGNLLTEIRYGGTLAVSGNLSGTKFSTTVFPFILRGISLQGIDSVYVTRERKMDLFNKMAREWKMENLDRVIYKEVAFKDLKEELLRESNGTGRVLVTFK
ncbi:acryloyl-CoA reductase [Proteiniclasticum sp. SCR006]|uniref:Acryloyl-CoA reductase n=1 Tax=Proteiniclasticum aestuarii TaxID=2817862 RepID=A0A939KIE0_9CLOT|nr:acryloyl-CoA reductase [Proteiniclasticum aestuarii]MBO1263866.1 acryloyl-CoA reductase [Proteiniclasticum aestuarii]